MFPHRSENVFRGEIAVESLNSPLVSAFLRYLLGLCLLCGVPKSQICVDASLIGWFSQLLGVVQAAPRR